jgi:diguanylate cyclase (GGDEF)-like protein
LTAIREQTTHRRAGEKNVYEVEIIRPDGERRSLLVTATPRFDRAGQFLGAFGIFRDITDRKGAEEKLRYVSSHDALTGLYNRAFFEEERARIERGRQFPISVVMADVDDLKVTNDRDGHAAGDELLRRTAQVLNASFRAEDLVARIGGDEFVALLPHADAAAVEAALTRVRNILYDHNASHGGMRLSLSLGASTAEKGASLTEALKQADARMYQEKHGK